MADDFKNRATFVISVCAGVIMTAVFVWMTRVILLLLFAGVIGALLLSTATKWTGERFKLRRGLALATVVVSFTICIGLGIWLRGPALAQQFSDLQIDLPSAAHEVIMRVQANTWGSWLLSRYADQAQLSDGLAYALTRVGGVVITTASTLVGLFVILGVSLYVAAEPSTYLGGLQRVTPPAYRVKLAWCLASAAQMLRSWLIAKAISMITIGALIAIGLWALKVPLAGTLGIIAGLLTFIPNLGPAISFLPAGLLAFADNPTKGILTVLLFCSAHFIEGNVVAPLLERKIVTLPPALTLAVQLLLASVSGAIGLALAAPLTAAALGILRALLPQEPEPPVAATVQNGLQWSGHATSSVPAMQPEGRAVRRFL